MKLYELKSNQKFKFLNVEGIFAFEKVDGMYARIYNEQGQLDLVACYAVVEVVE